MLGRVFPEGLHWIQSRVCFMGSQLEWARRIPQRAKSGMSQKWLQAESLERWMVKESESELGQQVQGALETRVQAKGLKIEKGDTD